MNKRQIDPDQQPNTDNMSIYDLPALNAVISQYEEPYMKAIKNPDIDSKDILTEIQ